MDEETKSVVAIILAITMAVTIVGSTIGLLDYLAFHQRHAFLLKCIAELGGNNIELCSSIVK